MPKFIGMYLAPKTLTTRTRHVTLKTAHNTNNDIWKVLSLCLCYLVIKTTTTTKHFPAYRVCISACMLHVTVVYLYAYFFVYFYIQAYIPPHALVYLRTHTSSSVCILPQMFVYKFVCAYFLTCLYVCLLANY